MKRWILIICFLGASFVFCKNVFSFDNKKTHPAITEKAIAASVLDNYLKTQLQIDDGINVAFQYNVEMYNEYIKRRMEKGGVENPYNPSRTILNWIKAGSNIEDEDDSFLWSIRARHHFHAPIANPGVFPPNPNAGLDDKTDDPNYSNLFAWLTGIFATEFDVTGQSALVWAIEGIAEQEPTGSAECWTFARDNFHAALTLPNKSWREEYFAAMFLELGCILHMIEDMGVPAHTRNDFLFAHYRPPLGFGNPLESWVEEQIIDNNGLSPWSGVWPVAFDKLAKYFDADAYTGGYLGDGIWPPINLWGLAECTNYQFLSLSTVFGCSGVKYQFPHPARGKSEPNLLEPVPRGEKVYFDGSNYCVTHLARDSYTRYVVDSFGYTSFPVIDSTITTDDDKVFIDYANITIPRTIDYATGLINYFFRGQMSVYRQEYEDDVVLTITNTSENCGMGQTLKGGTFELYWDDQNGVRTKITNLTVFEPVDPNYPWNSETSTLAYNQSTKATFTIPIGDVNDYRLIYKGNICQNPAAPDLDDLEAIATQRVLRIIFLVDEEDAKKVLVPTGDIGTSWRGGSEPYNDSGWIGGTGGVGYEMSSGYESYIDIDVGYWMYNINCTCYIRIPFIVDGNELENFDSLTLSVMFDDGFVAYINGFEVKRDNFTGTPGWNSAADNYLETSSFWNYDITSHIDKLQAGNNILAIHIMNNVTTSSDLLLCVKLYGLLQ